MDVSVDSLLAWKGIAVAAWFLLLFAGERLRPMAAKARGWFGDWPRLVRNGGLWLLNVGVSVLFVVPVSIWAAEHQFGFRPEWWGGGLGLLLDVVLLDFLIYWWHRANHEWRFLWRFHEVHHLDAFLDVTSAVRFHFGEVMLSALARAAVIVVFDVPLASVLTFEALILLAAMFHHSDLRLPAGLERALSRVIITPSIHWVHHHAIRRDTDSNYGTVFSFWDRLFGSRSPTARDPEMTIGVEARPEQPFLALLLSPFRPQG